METVELGSSQRMEAFHWQQLLFGASSITLTTTVGSVHAHVSRQTRVSGYFLRFAQEDRRIQAAQQPFYRMPIGTKVIARR